MGDVVKVRITEIETAVVLVQSAVFANTEPGQRPNPGSWRTVATPATIVGLPGNRTSPGLGFRPFLRCYLEGVETVN
jgi:hypothetical protein